MARAAKASVERRYQWSAIAADLERLYAQLAEGRTPAGKRAPALAQC
jgi:hypothetical protein